MIRTLSSMMAAGILASNIQAATLEEVATKTGATKNNAPEWIRHGAYVYRITTGDEPGLLAPMEEGMGIACNLFDRSVQQIAIANGLVGHDHPGEFNWDGLWPYWNRPTFRAGSWENLNGFMKRVNEKCNTKLSFHVNLTDVNIGLRDYPETREFFKKLVETKSIYRRDWNKTTNKRDLEPPYVPQEIDRYIDPKEKNAPDPVPIFALVNYKNFWDSGLAKEMIDEFYSHLPYAPPVLYLDVLTLEGGNFSTGYPDGVLGGGRETQVEGVLAIAKYLRSKGTEVGTEGDRSFMKDYGTYGWLHTNAGVSKDDYSKILGAAKGSKAVIQHVYGNTGCFVVCVSASTPGQIKKVRDHYNEILSGAPISRKMPGLETWHISDRGQANDEFNMMPGPRGGGGDPFRGDWIDLVNNFYLTGIQELYNIGKGNYRTAVYNKIGTIHISKFGITGSDGKETVIPISDCLAGYPDWARRNAEKSGHIMVESKLAMKFNAPQAGKYRIRLYGNNPGNGPAGLNVFVDGKLQLTKLDISFANRDSFEQPVDLGDITLGKGDNDLSFDVGPIYVKWNDGTTAIWESASLGKGFKVTNGDVTFAEDYDRMWPDTWSGQKKIYFFSWDGTSRRWKLPQEWRSLKNVTLHPLTPDGRGKGQSIAVEDGGISPKLLPQVPYILIE